MNRRRNVEYCTNCQHDQVFVRYSPHHAWHFFVTLCTLGLWAVSWVAAWIGARIHPWRCSVCGRPSNLGKAHHDPEVATSDFTGALTFGGGPATVNGAKFTPAPSGLPAGAYPFALTGAGFDIASTVTLLPNNTATVLAPVIAFYPRSKPGQPATGIFYTTFHAPAAPVRPLTRGSGIFHQKLGIGSGQFPHAGSVGRIQLGINPP